MHRAARSLVATSVLLATAGLTACGGGGTSDADIQADVAKQIVDQGFTEDQADCIAEVIVDEIGADTIKDVDFSAEDPEGLTDEIVEASLKAQRECLQDG